MSPLDHARMLLKKAGRNVNSVRVLLAGAAAPEDICYFAQQATEKSLKAILATDDVVYPKTHDLERLVDLAIPRVPELSHLRARVAALSPFAVDERYDDIVEPNEASARRALDTARAVYDLAARLINEREQ